ncbi:hypothetical protein [Devosia sp.]|uniref:hypothetical protein n=1 Tax=Devosia sp. TaxID=1871048 RepID=UPI0025E98789|nr:hypothetical protein [Devosia sp.]
MSGKYEILGSGKFKLGNAAYYTVGIGKSRSHIGMPEFGQQRANSNRSGKSVKSSIDHEITSKEKPRSYRPAA